MRVVRGQRGGRGRADGRTGRGARGRQCFCELLAFVTKNKKIIVRNKRRFRYYHFLTSLRTFGRSWGGGGAKGAVVEPKTRFTIHERRLFFGT